MCGGGGALGALLPLVPPLHKPDMVYGPHWGWGDIGLEPVDMNLKGHVVFNPKEAIAKRTFPNRTIITVSEHVIRWDTSFAPMV